MCLCENVMNVHAYFVFELQKACPPSFVEFWFSGTMWKFRNGTFEFLRCLLGRALGKCTTAASRFHIPPVYSDRLAITRFPHESKRATRDKRPKGPRNRFYSSTTFFCRPRTHNRSPGPGHSRTRALRKLIIVFCIFTGV
jgi:hypothetical protein